MTSIGLLTGMVALAASACDSPELRDELDDLGRGDGADGCAFQMPAVISASRALSSSGALVHDVAKDVATVAGAPEDAKLDSWAMSHSAAGSHLYHQGATNQDTASQDAFKFHRFTLEGPTYEYDDSELKLLESNLEGWGSGSPDPSKGFDIVHDAQGLEQLFLLDEGVTEGKPRVYSFRRQNADSSYFVAGDKIWYDIGLDEDYDFGGWAVVSDGTDLSFYAYANNCNTIQEWKLVAGANATKTEKYTFDFDVPHQHGHDGLACPEFSVTKNGDGVHFHLRDDAPSCDLSPGGTCFEEGTAIRLTNRKFGEGMSLDTYADDPSMLMAANGPYWGSKWTITSESGGYFRLTNNFWNFGSKPGSLDTLSDEEHSVVINKTGAYTGQFWRLVQGPEGCWRLMNNYLEGEGLVLATDEAGKPRMVPVSDADDSQCWSLTTFH